MIGGFRDDMCKCADRACADQFTEKLTTWGQQLAGEKHASSPISEDDTKKMAAITEEMTTCMTKAMTSK